MTVYQDEQVLTQGWYIVQGWDIALPAEPPLPPFPEEVTHTNFAYYH